VPFLIRRLTDADLDDVVALSLRAWAPVFESMRGALGEAVYRQLYPDWRATQARGVEQVCRSATEAWVADVAGRAVGFVAVVHHDETHDEPCSGEIEMVAVNPDHQRRGVADQLIAHALDAMRRAGLRLAVVATGGDPGHAPARAAYEKAGFTGLPLVRYYQAL
jgi:ribosomal protein S18 acetylase RimI-like enzyme